MRIVVSNGTVVTPGGCFEADICCEDGRIASLEMPARAHNADDVIDARGLYVFPGFIDPHVHSRDPGITEKEDFAHSTRAAAAGGVTTIFEMPNALPPVTDAGILRDRADQHSSVAFVDFGLWSMALGMENIDDLPGTIQAGAVGVKLFWGYNFVRSTKRVVYNLGEESPDDIIAPPNPGEVWELFHTVAAADGVLAAHCEDLTIVAAAQRALGRPFDDYQEFLATRPDTAEAAAVALAIELTRATRCRFHVVHLSSARGAELIRAAQRQGIPISAETCPQYLTFTDDSYDELGPVMKVFPPIYRASDRTALAEAVRDGTISSIGSDHAPHTIAEKRMPLAVQPAGFIGVETIVRGMLDHVNRGELSMERLASVLSEGTARLFGMYPQKGAIQPGADADFTLVDMESEWQIQNDELHSKNPISPWHGRRGRGAPKASILRGNIVMLNGELVGEAQGRFVSRNGAAVTHQARELSGS